MKNTPAINVEYDVIIVGCGPTGATLANLLCQSGVKVLVLERELAIYELPRAVHFDDETMRVFQTVGIANQLNEKVRVNPGMRFVGLNEELILDWPRPSSIGEHGWHSSYRLHQPDLEKLLRDTLIEQPLCTLKLGAHVVDVQHSDSCVQVTYQNMSSKHMHNVNAAFVVGCDGANSVVRQHMSSEMEDLGFNERWLVVDVLLKRDLPELGDVTIQYCNALQPMTYCRNTGLRRRWEMSLKDSISDDDARSDERIWSLLSRWVSKDNAKLERKAIYTFRSALAKKWRVNRLLIAGDSAHLTPPFMGQGMCTGIRDAANLAWKLSLCVSGQAELGLLDSYQEERIPHARKYITTAIQLGKLISSIDQHMSQQAGMERSKNPSTMTSLSVSLGQSHLSGLSAGGCALSGQLCGQPKLADGRLLDEYCGYRPVLLIRHGNTTLLGKQSDILWLSGDDHPELAKMLDSLSVTAILVRPDRYIFSSTNTDSDALGLLADFKMRLAAVMPTSRRG